MNKKYINNTLDTERNTLNISDDEKRFAIIDTLTVDGGQTITPVVTIRYQYDNHLGSACLELDNAGQIISYEEYHPFGTTSYRSGRSQTEVSLKRYKYCGKERDEETGLYYYGMRYYAAWICRFVSVDPLQFKYPELTPFQYASNRPITMIDLDGGEAGVPKQVRMIFWGGARSKSDNNAFYFASRNVIKDYNNDMTILDNKITTAKGVISKINQQKDNSIQSIDFFAHGSQYALYMVKNEKTGESSLINADISDENVQSNNLYASKTTKFFQSWGAGNKEDTIYNINFKKFTNTAKIEIHGCKSAGSTLFVDNIAKNLSEELYAAGKNRAVVIAHITKANPNIEGDPVYDKDGKLISGTSREKQDYRHRERAVYHNGEILFTTSIKGRIKGDVIDYYLNKKEKEGDKYEASVYVNKKQIKQ